MRNTGPRDGVIRTRVERMEERVWEMVPGFSARTTFRAMKIPPFLSPLAGNGWLDGPRGGIAARW